MFNEFSSLNASEKQYVQQTLALLNEAMKWEISATIRKMNYHEDVKNVPNPFVLEDDWNRIIRDEYQTEKFCNLAVTLPSPDTQPVKFKKNEFVVFEIPVNTLWGNRRELYVAGFVDVNRRNGTTEFQVGGQMGMFTINIDRNLFERHPDGRLILNLTPSVKLNHNALWVMNEVAYGTPLAARKMQDKLKVRRDNWNNVWS